jgi:hypothetical protein
MILWLIFAALVILICAVTLFGLVLANSMVILQGQIAALVEIGDSPKYPFGLLEDLKECVSDQANDIRKRKRVLGE